MTAPNPRPAFIPCYWPEIARKRRLGDAVEGYIWQPATESTMAGWVLPKGGDPEPLSLPDVRVRRIVAYTLTPDDLVRLDES